MPREVKALLFSNAEWHLKVQHRSGMIKKVVKVGTSSGARLDVISNEVKLGQAALVRSI